MTTPEEWCKEFQPDIQGWMRTQANRELVARIQIDALEWVLGLMDGYPGNGHVQLKEIVAKLAELRGPVLKPCPVCNFAKVELRKTELNGRRYFYYTCLSITCGMRTCDWSTKWEARNAWNSRPLEGASREARQHFSSL